MNKDAEEIEKFIDEFREMFSELSIEEREILIAGMFLGYCRDCWIETHGRVCHCTNDE